MAQLGFEKFCEIDKCLHGGTFQHWLQLRHCFPLETFAGSYDAACQDDSRICFVQMPAVLEPTITALNANLGYDAVRFISMCGLHVHARRLFIVSCR